GRRCFPRDARESRGVAACIFFLTFSAKNLIKKTQPRSRKRARHSDVKGESIDEERNEEKGACQEEGCSEEKEVVAKSRRTVALIGNRSLVRVQTIGPEKSGPFLFWSPRNRGRSYLAPEKSGPF